MIHTLLIYLKDTLLPGAVGSVAVQMGEPSGTPPGVGLWAGPAEASREASDLSSSQARPQGARLRVNPTPFTAGPHALGKSPLQGSVLCRLVVSAGQDERSLLLREGNHFIVDYPQGEITLQPGVDISKAKALLVEYSFVGVFTVREFRQEFFIEAQAGSPQDAERLAALCLAALLTNHDAALEHFNQNARYDGGDYQSVHSLSQVQWLSSNPHTEGGQHRYRLTFSAKGQLKAVKGEPGSFGIIEQVRSPGTDPDTRPVNIEPELG